MATTAPFLLTAINPVNTAVATALQWFCNGSAMVRLRHSNGKEEVLNFNFPYEVELGAKIV